MLIQEIELTLSILNFFNLYLSKVVNLKPAWLLEASSSPFLLHGMVFLAAI